MLIFNICADNIQDAKKKSARKTKEVTNKGLRAVFFDFFGFIYIARRVRRVNM